MFVSRTSRVAAALVVSIVVVGCSSGDSSTSPPSTSAVSTPDSTEADAEAEADADPDAEAVAAEADAEAAVDAEGLEPGWLVLVYQAADNDLEAAILTDIAELGDVSVDDMDVVVMLDRHDDADPAGGFSDADTYEGIPEELGASQVLLAGTGGVSVLGTIAEVNTGDPAALADFISGAIAQYPREHVAVIIGDHGAAWRGVGHDDTSGDVLELGELSVAFEAALAGSGRDRFDLIGFDACLMATLEVAAAVAPYGDYLLASEEVEPGAGWDWTVLNGVSADTDAVSFGQILADGYTAFYADESQISNQTMSLTDLSKVDELSSALSAMIAVSGTDPTASAVAVARSAVRAYGFAASPDPAQSYHQLDIGDLVETLAVQNPTLAEQADVVLDALNAAVVSNSYGTISDQATGLSIYLPPNADLAEEEYLALGGMRDWQGLLASYLEVTASVAVPAAFADEDKLIEGRWTSGGFELSADYDPAADATVVDARLRYGTYTADYTSMEFYGSDPLSFGDGFVSGVWDPQVMQITDGSTTAFAYSTFVVAGDRSRAIISVPLRYLSPAGDSERVELRFVFDQAGALLSKDFVVFSGYGVGRATVDPAGQMFPLAAVQSIETFEEEWLQTTDVGFSADIADLDGGYVPMPETTAIVAQLELHALDGSVDFLYAGDAVPFEFHTARSSYPAPG